MGVPQQIGLLDRVGLIGEMLGDVVRALQGKALVDDLVRAPQRNAIARAFIALDLPEHLAHGPVAAEELASRTATDPTALRRLLRAATAIGLCRQAQTTVELTEAGQMLQRDAPGQGAEWMSLMGAPWVARAWDLLAESVQTGRSAFPSAHGVGFWQYVTEHPDEAVMFNAAMTGGAAARAADLAEALDWSAVRTVVDIGGGQGLLIAELMARLPSLQGVVADRPEVVATPVIGPAASRGAVTFVGCDFFEEVPQGGDVYVLSRVLHDWADAEALTVLRRCRTAMHPESRLCILEQLAPHPADVSADAEVGLAIKDLNMLVLVGGQERTVQDYERLLKSADLEIHRVHSGGTTDIVEAHTVA